MDQNPPALWEDRYDAADWNVADGSVIRRFGCERVTDPCGCTCSTCHWPCVLPQFSHVSRAAVALNGSFMNVYEILSETVTSKVVSPSSPLGYLLYLYAGRTQGARKEEDEDMFDPEERCVILVTNKKEQDKRMPLENL